MIIRLCTMHDYMIVKNAWPSDYEYCMTTWLQTLHDHLIMNSVRCCMTWQVVLSRGGYTSAIDLWSLGCIFGEMLQRVAGLGAASTPQLQVAPMFAIQGKPKTPSDGYSSFAWLCYMTLLHDSASCCTCIYRLLSVLWNLWVHRWSCMHPWKVSWRNIPLKNGSAIAGWAYAMFTGQK